MFVIFFNLYFTASTETTVVGFKKAESTVLVILIDSSDGPFQNIVFFITICLFH